MLPHHRIQLPYPHYLVMFKLRLWLSGCECSQNFPLVSFPGDIGIRKIQSGDSSKDQKMVSTIILFLKSFPSKTSFACQESKRLNILKSTLQTLNIHFILREDFNQLQVYNLKIQLIQQC